MKRLLLSALLLVTNIAFAQPANDECANATPIPVNSGLLCTQSVSSSLTGATPSPSSIVTGCANTQYNDVWFSFTPTTVNHTITIVPAQPGLVLNFFIYSGNCNSLQYQNCNSANTNPENLVIGQTYKIRVFTESMSATSLDFSICINTAEIIIVNTSQTAQQLVQDVLIGTPCMVVSNIATSGGATYNLPSSIGTFNKSNASFPLESGIVLSTGAATKVPGPNKTYQNNVSGWPGDQELAQIMGMGNYMDATSLEFDFVPVIDHISFDYLFASGEYGMYQCAYADAFAFILTDVLTGVKTNLAVVPGTNTPVAVTTINDAQYIPSGVATCPSVNSQYFGSYYGTVPFAAPINFNGITVPMTAQSAVTPGHQYHIKIVIANRSDHLYNSAVFLKAGSFNIGSIDSGYTQLTSSAGPVLCNGQSTLLSVNGSSSLNYTWKHNGNPVPGATSNTLTATEAGTYTVNMAIPGNSGCSVEHSITLHFAEGTTAPALEDMWVYEPNSDGMHPFNLAAQATAITSQTGYANMVVSFHLTEADAQANVNPLTTPYVNIANPQDIYVRVQNPSNNCYVVSMFSIGAVDENYETPPPTGAGTQGFEPGDTLADIEIDGENIQWYDNPGSDATGRFTTDSVDTPLPLTTPLVNGMTYYASQTKFGRESVERLPVTIDAAAGVSNNNFKNFSYRPNPVKDVLQLSNSIAIDKVEIYTIVGQKIKSATFGKTDATVDFSSLTNGVYVVKVTSANAEKTIKIVKQ